MLRKLVTKPAIYTKGFHQDNIEYQTLQYVCYITQILENTGLIITFVILQIFRKYFDYYVYPILSGET